MTKGEALAILAACPDDDLGDVLLQLGATYWLEKPDMSKDDVLFVFEEVLNESSGE